MHLPTSGHARKSNSSIRRISVLCQRDARWNESGKPLESEFRRLFSHRQWRWHWGMEWLWWCHDAAWDGEWTRWWSRREFSRGEWNIHSSEWMKRGATWKRNAPYGRSSHVG